EEGAGIFFQIMAFFSIASVFVTFGADTGLVRTLAAQKVMGTAKHLRNTLVIAGLPVLTFATVVSLAFWLYAEPLEQLFGVPGLREVIRVMAPMLVPAAITNLGFGAMRGMGRVASF